MQLPTKENSPPVFYDRLLAILTQMTGGTIGEVWAKDSSTDFDATWKGALEALEDEGFWEEGSWTPVLSTSGTGSVTTYVDQVGYYFLLGSFVYIWCTVHISAHTMSGGSLLISGLPFAAFNDVIGGPLIARGFDDINVAAADDCSASVVQNASVIYLWDEDYHGGTRARVSDSEIGNNFRVHIAGMYRAA